MRRSWLLSAALLTALSLLAGATFLPLTGAARAAGTTSAPAQEPAPPPAPETPPDPAVKALAVMKRRCADCHGKKAGSDFVKFNYIEDLARVAGNKKFITPGNPDKSNLFLYIAHTKKPYMPAKREPLTADELAAVKAWIAALPVPQK